MRLRIPAIVAGVAVALVGLGLAAADSAGGGAPDWAVNATAIEACSCPMFCQCYFNREPAGHADHGAGHEAHGGAKHFCKANLAYRINKGHHGATKLDGAKFWVATPTYYEERQVDPWILGEVDGAEMFAVIAQW